MKAPRISASLLASASVLALLAATAAQAVPILAVNLTLNNSGTISDGANTVTFNFDKQQPSGTGVLDRFLRVQDNGTEQGYNSTQANQGAMPFDAKHGWTFDLAFSALQVVNGTYNFVLDIGEPVSDNANQGQQSLLSLDGLKLYVTNTPGQNSSSVDSGTGDANGISGTLLWNMDAQADNYILLDANRNGNPGNGVSDMLMQVPTSVFSSVTSSQYIILWSRFGLQGASNNGAESSGTFEEWAQLKVGDDGGGGGGGSVPEPASLLLMGAGLMGLGFARRRKAA